MYRKILVPMALSHDLSPETLKAATALLAEGGEIVAIHVFEEAHGTAVPYAEDETVKSGFEAARDLLKTKLEAAPRVTGHVVTGHSARTIIDFAAKNGVDCIVIGSHKPGLTDYFLGSTTERVVRHAHCAVHVVRSGV
ncbi:MAG: universal stress protein [Pseudomonadota bacterium]